MKLSIFKPVDIVFVVPVLFFSLLILIKASHIKPTVYEIRTAKGLYAKYPLDQDRMIEVKTDSGSITILVTNNTLRFCDASCPNKICIHTGTISKAGQSVVCAPDKVMAILVGESDIDSISK